MTAQICVQISVVSGIVPPPPPPLKEKCEEKTVCRRSRNPLWVFAYTNTISGELFFWRVKIILVTGRISVLSDYLPVTCLVLIRIPHTTTIMSGPDERLIEVSQALPINQLEIVIKVEVNLLTMQQVWAMCLCTLSGQCVCALCLGNVSVHSVWAALYLCTLSGHCVCTLSGLCVCALCLGIVSVHSVWALCLCTLSGQCICVLCLGGIVSVHSVWALCLCNIMHRLVPLLVACGLVLLMPKWYLFGLLGLLNVKLLYSAMQGLRSS